jgi:predicted amidohydrolase
VKVAAAQISCALGDLRANMEKIREFSSRAKSGGADLIVFPEMIDTGYAMPVIQKHATAWSEGAVPGLQKIARDLSIWLIGGVSDRDGSRIYNAQVFIDSSGKVVGKYRKTHLVTAGPLDERSCFSAGDAFVNGKIDQFNLGLTICYDLRFPEVCRILAVEHQVNVFVNSSAWPFPRVEHLRIMALSRAIENQSYLVLASAIIDPYGTILAAASVDREELIQAEISKDVIDSVRSRMAVFDHRRRDLY